MAETRNNGHVFDKLLKKKKKCIFIRISLVGSVFCKTIFSIRVRFIRSRSDNGLEPLARLYAGSRKL